MSNSKVALNALRQASVVVAALPVAIAISLSAQDGEWSGLATMAVVVGSGTVLAVILASSSLPSRGGDETEAAFSPDDDVSAEPSGEDWKASSARLEAEIGDLRRHLKSLGSRLDDLPARSRLARIGDRELVTYRRAPMSTPLHPGPRVLRYAALISALESHDYVQWLAAEARHPKHESGSLFIARPHSLEDWTSADIEGKWHHEPGRAERSISHFVVLVTLANALALADEMEVSEGVLRDLLLDTFEHER